MIATDHGLATTVPAQRTVGPMLLQIGQNKARDAAEQERKFRPNIYWYLSFRCNLACEHCWVNSSPWVDTSDDLTFEQAMSVVEQMAELNVRTAILSGGEVTIFPRYLEIIQALADSGIRVNVETNGLRFTPKFVETVKRLQRDGMFGMTVSLDGGTAETHSALRGKGTFERTVRGLRFLSDNEVDFAVQAVLNRTNYGTIPDLFNLVQELQPHCRSLSFAFLNPLGRGKELIQSLGLSFSDYNAIFELIKQSSARTDITAIVKTPPATIPPQYIGTVFANPKARPSVSCQFPLLGVLPGGDITICALSRDNEDLHLGNVRTHNLKEVWKKTRMDMLRSQYLSGEHLSGVCSDCVWKYQCKGGCRAWAYENGGSFEAPLPLCAALDEAGEFPDVYRISVQNAAVSRLVQEHHAAAGCGCG